MAALDDELKLKVSEVNQLKGSLQTIERKTQGNLMVRGLDDIVNEEDLMESEFMTTTFAVVPKAAMKDFEGYYEKMARYVVPRSGMLITEDMEYALYRVILFKKSADEFKAAAREKRLTLREHTHDPRAMAAEEQKKVSDGAEFKRLRDMLSNWCNINYAEAYKYMMHLKAVRIFVESVLRYGLKGTYNGMVPNFQSFLLVPKKGKAEALRKLMSSLYAGGADAGEADGEEMNVPGATGEFYPYVYASIETEPSLA